MEDDICVILTAEDARSREAFKLSANQGLYRAVTVTGNDQFDHSSVVGSRDPTPAPDVAEREVCQLILRFSNPPKNPQLGWSFGRDSNCDVVLSDHSFEMSKFTSSRHFHIRASDEGHLFLDDRSTHGTAVGYDGTHKDDSRSKETWLISRGGHDRPLANKVRVTLANKMGFSIEAPRSDDKRVALYKQGQNGLPPLGVLGLDSGYSTARPSLPDTPRGLGSRPALYLPLRRIGSGSFGHVDEVISLRDGKVYARKQLRALIATEMHKRKHDKSMTQFENEVELMRKVNHKNVVRLVDVALDPQPILYMPFFEAGSMEDHRDELSEEQTVCILRQLLVGTVYLHGENIIHRDLKPANVLLDLGENRIRAVITDLGLSKMLTGVDTSTNSFCGTYIYMAPEVESKRYGPKVDEYAIGIIGMEYIYYFKENPYSAGNPRWKDAQRENIIDLDEDQLSGILIGLTHKEPRTRFTAETCLDLGCEKELWTKRDNLFVDIREVAAAGLTSRPSTISPTSTRLDTDRPMTVKIFRPDALASLQATPSVPDTDPPLSTLSSLLSPLSPSSVPSFPSQPP